MATASVNITMNGLKEFDAALGSLANRQGVNKRVIQKAIGPRASGPQYALAKIRELVPVAAESYFRYYGGKRVRVRPGALKRGIRIRALKSKRGKFQNFGSVIFTPTREKLKIPGDYKWYYPALLEYGWNPRRKGIGQAVKRIARKVLRLKGKAVAPRSFMRKGLDENRATIFGMIAKDLKAAIQEHVAKEMAKKRATAAALMARTWT